MEDQPDIAKVIAKISYQLSYKLCHKLSYKLCHNLSYKLCYKNIHKLSYQVGQTDSVHSDTLQLASVFIVEDHSPPTAMPHPDQLRRPMIRPESPDWTLQS